MVDENMERQAKSREMQDLLDRANIRLAEIREEYLVSVNSMAIIDINDEIGTPGESDLGERIRDPEGEIRKQVDDLLAYSHINEAEVVRDLLPGHDLRQEEDEGPDSLVVEVLRSHIVDVIMDLLRSTRTEMYRLTESAFDKYVGDMYHVYFETVGYIHFLEPEDCWAILHVEWTD